MLSILIPCYNYDILPLVSELHQQVKALAIEFEILVYDDASNSKFNKTNASINNLKGCCFKILSNNIGRSKIRNLLGNDASYENLLFMDADTFPQQKNFIKNYLSHENEKVVYGGITNEVEVPEKPYKLRWLYTKKRETQSICSSNFLIKKSVFLLNQFDETLTTYGYEDVVFFAGLKENNIKIKTIQNWAIHRCQETADNYISKLETGLQNLLYLIEGNKLAQDESKLHKFYALARKFGMVPIVVLLFKTLKKGLIKNFNSSHPSIILLDFYKLGYFCLLKTKK